MDDGDDDDDDDDYDDDDLSWFPLGLTTSRACPRWFLDHRLSPLMV